ncbi:hypothetical protein AAEX28_12360 [Lentisphaerota bacterium WC36G]|nr:hypothetical protein LJT99_15190 [Lentisphaerae bacterium WC36]
MKKLEAKKKFGYHLKSILNKYSIKAKDVADFLKVSPQYLTEINSGRSVLKAEYFNTIIEFLNNKISDDEMDVLVSLFIEARSGIDLNTLITKENNIQLSSSEIDLILKIRNLDKTNRKLIFDLLDAISK